MFNFDISVWLVLEELGPLFDDLGLHNGSKGSHDTEQEMGATSLGSAGEELLVVGLFVHFLLEPTKAHTSLASVTIHPPTLF